MAVGAAALIAANATNAEKKYDPGASDTEIRIGNIMPYSGPASSYGVIGKAEAAYFNMINAQGGINGRKIASSPMTTPTARRKRSSRPASWSRATRSC
jgi:ABC-type branched-subunit amino acid transport system substrate-binding protein